MGRMGDIPVWKPWRRSIGGGVTLLALVLGCVPAIEETPLPSLVGELDPASTPIGCDRAAERVTLLASAHLDPACTYSGGFELRASDVTLDCRGARIEDPSGAGSRGILVASPADRALANVTVRNCVLKGFLNGVRVTREGFESLPAGAEYDAAFSNVAIENLHVYATRGSGVFVDGYVTGVTLRQLEIAGAGSVGVYLEAGSRDNAVERCAIHHNGFGDVVPEGVPIDLGGLRLRYESTGREGIAIDGSRGNRIARNEIHSNSAGGIFLYKNCGEFATQRPAQWWTRRYGADDNLIEDNLVHHEKNGVWIGSRMNENQLMMDCSDPAYVDEPLIRVHRDRAAGNVVRANAFYAVGQGVRVEDDRSRIEGNWFFGEDPAAQAVLVGTGRRTAALGEPVTSTTIAGNHAVTPNAQPFGWVHGHAGTTYDDNRVHANVFDAGVPVALAPGVQPVVNPFLFVIRFWLEP
jgi:parallel beta-helix repeat protein